MRITRAIIFTGVSFLRTTFLIVIACSAISSIAQVYEDFSDGDLSNNPAWSGDLTDFILSSSSAVPPGQEPALKLNSPGGDTSMLVLGSPLVGQTEWRFWIKLSFNTSANNYARVYLVSDQPDLAGAVNGYFVQLGGANDSIGLFRQTGYGILQLIWGTHGYLGNSTNEIRVKVTRDSQGSWHLYSDPAGGYNFELEGSCLDESYSESSFFGLFCKYTPSNSSKFYFDDVYINDLYADTIPPLVEEVTAGSSSALRIIFSEGVEPAAAEDTTHYLVSGGVGNPMLALHDPYSINCVDLLFSSAFETGIDYTLQVQGVADLQGNIMPYQAVEFVFISIPEASPFDVVINEVMADVNPAPAGLPEADYIELYNRAPHAIQLDGFTLKPRESSDPIKIPDVMLPPDGFLIITTPAAASEFESYGPVAGLSGFSINNEGTVVLRNGEGLLIHALQYDKSWYGDEEKAEGGWSLEQIDPDNPCSLVKTWSASNASAGGTPGSLNTVDGLVNSGPEILTVQVQGDPNVLRLEFSHHMDSSSLTTVNSYGVEGVGCPLSAVADEVIFDGVDLSFEQEFDPDKEYVLTITDTLKDCSGKYINPGMTFVFIRPGEAGPYDVVINEIMADPDPPVGLPGHEYIELFNAAGGYIHMKDWVLESGSGQWLIPELTIQPQEYVLLVGSEAGLILALFGRAFLVQGMGLPNTGGVLILKDALGEVMSVAEYSSLFYSDPSKAAGGYSLEQIDPYNPCEGIENWTQTLAVEGGTPGALNSVDAMKAPLLEIQSAVVLDATMLDVVFSQNMAKNSLEDASLYVVDQGMGSPISAEAVYPFYNRVLLIFGDSFVAGTGYRLSFTREAANCTGIEVIPGDSFPFGVAEPAEGNDVVINEVLFNPLGEGVDFVEVYNRSYKVINLNSLRLGSVKADAAGYPDTSHMIVVTGDRLLMPGEYLVCTSDPVTVQDQYSSGSLRQFIRMGSFPSYNNAMGTVLLTRKDGEVIDVMRYDERMHHPLLTLYDGVSLERIHYNRPSGDRTNWHSASTECGYATPALQNSQFVQEGGQGDELVIEPEIFSPDNDGYQDNTLIYYRMPSPGFLASVTIFDPEGRPVRYLVNNEMLGTAGSFSWDGITEARQKANTGIYLIYLEAFDQSGRLIKRKKTVVVGGRSR